MVDKNQTAIVAVGAGTIVALMLAVGFLSERDQPKPTEAGQISKPLERFRSVPYTFFTPDTVDTARSGVVLHDPGKAWGGYNFYGTGWSGKVILMDMAGRAVHTWTDPLESPGAMTLAELLPNGDMVAVQRFRGLIRLDWEGNLLWQKTMRAHHDLALLPDSTFYALDRKVKQYRGLMVRFERIVLMSGAGEVLETWSTYENLHEIKQKLDRRDFLDTVLDSLLAANPGLKSIRKIPEEVIKEDANLRGPIYDYFHLNTIKILPDNALGEDRRFRAGNLLTCSRNVSQILILDRDTKEIVWTWGAGELDWPHHPTMLENGNILVFDNGVERRYSRIVELDPASGSIEWQYIASPPESFFCRFRGSCQRLPNGNTLISDTEAGRVFEITRDGEVVWDWLNPEIEEGKRARIYRMVRLPYSQVDPLLARP